MVGGDCCEDRNHRQLDISTGKPLGRPFQAIGIQPICHLRVHRDICLDLQTSMRFISGQFPSANKRVLINVEAENNCHVNISLLFAPARKLLLQSTALVWITDLHLMLKYLIYTSMIYILYSLYTIQDIRYIMNNCCML